MHRPELPLPASAFRGLGRAQRVWMHVLEWKMAKGDPDPTVKTLEQQLDRRLRLLAVRALEVPVLDHGHGGMLSTGQVIDRADRDGELEGSMPIHGFLNPAPAQARRDGIHGSAWSLRAHRPCQPDRSPDRCRVEKS